MGNSVFMPGSGDSSVGEREGAMGSSNENHRLKHAISQAVAIVSERGPGQGSAPGQGLATASGKGLAPEPGIGMDADIRHQLESQSSSQVSSVQGTITSHHNTTKRTEKPNRSVENNARGQGLGTGPGQGKRNSVLLKGTYHHYGHTKEKEHIQKTVLGQGKVFAEEILHKSDLITLGYSVTALTSVDLLVLQKNDYDKFLKDIRSSERREIYVCLRDNWLCENWNRTRLERLTNACKKRTYEKGEYLFRQGDLPDVLYILFQGRVDLVSGYEITFLNNSHLRFLAYVYKLFFIMLPLYPFLYYTLSI